MTHDLIGFDEKIDEAEAPPLCLVHYFAPDSAYPPERIPKPPGGMTAGRVAERRGNLIILEFTSLPKAVLPKRGARGRWLHLKIGDWLMVLMFLGCLLGCLAAFRF